MLATSFETIEAHKLRVARLGAGEPIIFLHGYPDNLQIWCELATNLSDKFLTLAFDWPGTGFSDEWRGGATPSHLADRLLKLIDFWGFARVSIVGMDMGGQPALVFASRYSNRIRHLTIMNSLVFGDERTSLDIAILRKFGWNRIILQRLPEIVFSRAIKTFLPSGVSLPVALKQDLWNSFSKPQVRAFISKMCAGYQGTLSSLPALYATISCPVLILWAEHDRHFPVSQAEKLKETISQSELLILKGAEHWMVWYRAEEVSELIRASIGKAVAQES